MSPVESSLLSPVDAAWLAMETPANPMTITVMMRVDGLTVEGFLDFLESHWLQWPRFRRMPVHCGAAWWWEEDPVFSLHHHFRVVPEAFSESELQDWVSNRLNQPLRTYRPRWCFWLAPHADGGAALLLRMHHCYGDGLSLIGLFNAVTTATPEATPVGSPGMDAGGASRWLEAGWQWLKSQVQLAGGDARSPRETTRRQAEHHAYNGLRLVNEVSGYLLQPEDTPSSLKPGLLGRRICRWSEPVPLAHFKAAAQQTGCKVNDVLLACVAEAMRRHLALDNDELEDMILHAAVPVDIRGLLPDHVRPEPGQLGNLFGTVFVPLPVDAQSPLEGLYRVKHETRRLKKSWQPGISWGLMCSAGLLPRRWQQAAGELFSRKASAVVSNVPGVAQTRYLAGCRVRQQMFWVPASGDIGLGVSIVSYAGGVQFGVVSDEAVMTDPQPFLDDCLATLNHWQ